MMVPARAVAPRWLQRLCVCAMLTGWGCAEDLPSPVLVPAVAAAPDPALAGLPVRVGDVSWHLDSPTSTEAARIVEISRGYKDRFVAGLIRANLHVLASTDTSPGALEMRAAMNEVRDSTGPMTWTVTLSSGPDVVEVLSVPTPRRVRCEHVATCIDALRESSAQEVVNAVVTSAKVHEWARRSKTPAPVVAVKAPEPVVVAAPPPPVAVVVPPPPAPGCVNDAQCKGDRICEDGKCVTPSRATQPAVATPRTPPPPRATTPAAPECRRRCRDGEALNAAGCCDKQ